MIRDVQIEEEVRTGGDDPRTFEIKFFLNLRKAPLLLRIRTDMTKSEILESFLEFIRRMFRLMEYEE